MTKLVVPGVMTASVWVSAPLAVEGQANNNSATRQNIRTDTMLRYPESSIPGRFFDGGEREGERVKDLAGCFRSPT